MNMKITVLVISLLFTLSANAQYLQDTTTGQQKGAAISHENFTSALSNDEDEPHIPGMHVYHVNPWVTGSISAGGAAYSLYMLTVLQKKPEITHQELQDLQPGLLQGFDSWVLHQSVGNLKQLENYSIFTQVTAALVPLTIFFDNKVSRDWTDVLLIFMEVNAINATIYMSPLGPVFQNKFRPLAYYTQLPEDQRNTGGSRNSFYSGHVAAAAADMFSMAKVYCDYHPELGDDKAFVYGIAAIPPVVMTYLRIRALDHFPSDLFVGWLVGTTCGVLIPEIHRIADKHLSLGPYIPPGGGSGLTFAWRTDD